MSRYVRFHPLHKSRKSIAVRRKPDSDLETYKLTATFDL
jgi:hypothetical protein